MFSTISREAYNQPVQCRHQPLLQNYIAVSIVLTGGRDLSVVMLMGEAVPALAEACCRYQMVMVVNLSVLKLGSESADMTRM